MNIQPVGDRVGRSLEEAQSESGLSHTESMDLTVSTILTGDSDSEIDDLRGEMEEISLVTKVTVRLDTNVK